MSISWTDQRRSELVQSQRLDDKTDTHASAPPTGLTDKQDSHAAVPAKPKAVIFVGPRHDPEAVAQIVQHCTMHDLDFTLIQTEHEGLSDSTKERLYAEGRLGPETQVFALFHGGMSKNGSQHRVEVRPGAAQSGTLDFMLWLRTPPAHMPAGPDRGGFHGTIHLHSCKGNLRDELTVDSALWNMGSCIAYSSRKNNLIEAGVDFVLDTLEKMARTGNELGPFGAIDLLAHAAGISGDTIVGLGADFSGPLVVRAPKTMDETRSASLIEALQAGRQETNCVIGTQQDRQALLAAMNRTGQEPEPERDRIKLENSMVTRVFRQNLEQVSAFLATDPALSTIEMSDGTKLHELAGMLNNEDLLQTIMQHRHQVLRAEFVPRALDACRAGNVGQFEPLLRQADKQGFVWGGDDIRDLADAAHRDPNIESSLMRWACRKNQIGLVKALMDRQGERARTGFAQKHLAQAGKSNNQMVSNYLRQFCKATPRPASQPGDRAAAAILGCKPHEVDKLLYQFRSVGIVRDAVELTRLVKGVSRNQQVTDAMLEWACCVDEPGVMAAVDAVLGGPYLLSKNAQLREIALRENGSEVLDYLARHRAAAGEDRTAE